MKRIVRLTACVIALTLCLCFSVSAAANNDKLTKDIVAVMPDKYEEVLMPQAEKIIQQVTITDDQYAQLKAILDETDAKIDFTIGQSLDEYSQSDRDYLLKQFQKALDVLNLHYTMSHDPITDDIATVYDANGNKLGTLDGDIGISKTDSGVPAWTWVLVVLAATALAGSVVVYSRKRATA